LYRRLLSGPGYTDELQNGRLLNKINDPLRKFDNSGVRALLVKVLSLEECPKAERCRKDTRSDLSVLVALTETSENHSSRHSLRFVTSRCFLPEFAIISIPPARFVNAPSLACI